MSRCIYVNGSGQQCVRERGSEDPCGMGSHQFANHTLRSPTAVEPRRGMSPWVHQREIEAGASWHEPTNFEGSILRVAMMSESDLYAKLVITAGHQRVELPMTYLAHLWPEPLKLDVAITFARGFELAAYGARGLVVLMGARL